MKSPDYDGPILQIDNLSISFFTRLREIPAVMDFSVSVQPGDAILGTINTLLPMRG